MRHTATVHVLTILIGCAIAAPDSECIAQSNTIVMPGLPDSSKFNSLTTEAYALSKKGDNTKAIETFQQAVAVGEKTFGSDNPLIRHALSGLAFAHSAIGNYAESIRLGQRVLAISERRYGGELASDLLDLAIFFARAENYKEAIVLFERALRLRESIFGPESMESQRVLSHLAYCENRLNREARALSYLERCRTILQAKLPDAITERAQIEQMIAWNLEELGDLDRAVAVSTANLRLLEDKFGKRHPILISYLRTLGRQVGKKENHQEEVKLLRQALELSIAATGPKTQEAADLHGALATALANCDQVDQAVTHAYEAVRIIEAVSGSANDRLLLHLPGLAIVLNKHGDQQAAMGIWEQNLSLAKQLYGEEHPKYARALGGLASGAALIKDYVRADELAKRSLGIYERNLGRFDRTMTGALNLMALIRVQQGDDVGAVEKLAEMLSVIRFNFPEDILSLASPDRMKFIDRFRFLSEMVHSIGSGAELKTSLAGRTTICAMAEALALDKASLLRLEAAESAMESDQQTQTRVLRDQYQSARLRLKRLEELKAEPTARLRGQRELYAELREIETQLASRVSLVEEAVRGRNLTLNHIASSLPKESVLVDFVRYRRYELGTRTNRWKEAWREEHFACYLTHRPAPGMPELQVDRVNLGEAAPIDGAISDLHHLFAEGRLAPSRLEPVLQRLRMLIYSPLARHITNVSHLIICPDAQLGRLPFELLPVDAKGRLLVEDKLITYVGSGRDVARLAKTRSSIPVSAPLVMGNPDFNLDFARSSRPEDDPSKVASRSSEPGTNGQSFFTRAAPNRMRSQDISSRGLKFNPLPGSEREARSVATLLGRDAIVRLGAAARESELKAVVSPSVLHLATHGFFLTDQEFKRTNSFLEPWRLAGEFTPYPRAQEQDWENPLIRCGIALAGVNHASSITNALAEDGLLTGLEASLLNLQGTKLVILSACDTGSGDVKIGEGVMSLRRAFTIAGAETVLASHWKVNDEATSLLMTEFIRRWKAGEPRGQAWRQAQLSLLRSKDYSNPYFWAAFTLTGQWR